MSSQAYRPVRLGELDLPDFGMPDREPEIAAHTADEVKQGPRPRPAAWRAAMVRAWRVEPHAAPAGRERRSEPAGADGGDRFARPH